MAHQDLDLRWPPIESLRHVPTARGPQMDIEEKYLSRNATVRQEQLRRGSSVFTKVHDAQYKIRLSCPRSSDGLGGIQWDIPASLHKHISAVYILWNNDIIDYLQPTYVIDDNDTASGTLRYIYTSTEFTLERPFITTPFYTKNIHRPAVAASVHHHHKQQQHEPTLQQRLCESSKAPAESTASTSSMASHTIPPSEKTTTSTNHQTMEEILILVVQLRSPSDGSWTAESLTLYTSITGWVIKGIRLLAWVADAYNKQQRQLQETYRRLYGNQDKNPVSSVTTFYACPWQKHKLVWPLYSLGNDAFLCCESTEKNSIGIRWTKCSYRTRPSFRITARLHSPFTSD
jgi:hypothetical protein